MTRRDAPGQAEGPTAGASWHPPSLVPVASARGGGPPSRGGGGAVGGCRPASPDGRRQAPRATGRWPVAGGGRGTEGGGRGRRVGRVTWAAALTSRRRGTWHPNHDGATRRVQPRQSTVDPWAGFKVFDTPKLSSWRGAGFRHSPIFDTPKLASWFGPRDRWAAPGAAACAGAGSLSRPLARGPGEAARATERRRGRDRVVGADPGDGYISWEIGTGVSLGSSPPRSPPKIYIDREGVLSGPQAPTGPQAGLGERPGRPSWAGRDGRRYQRGGGFRHAQFSTYPVFDIPSFRHTQIHQLAVGPNRRPPSWGPGEPSAPERFLTGVDRQMRASERAAGARTTAWRTWRTDWVDGHAKSAEV
jgi:hypothetical protein